MEFQDRVAVVTGGGRGIGFVAPPSEDRESDSRRIALDGRLPDLFLVSSMQVHAGACYDLIRDVCLIEPA